MPRPGVSVSMGFTKDWAGDDLTHLQHEQTKRVAFSYDQKLFEDMSTNKESVQPDFDGLDPVQAQQLSGIADAMEKRMRAELGQYIGTPITPENTVRMQAELIKGMEQELYGTLKVPAQNIAVSPYDVLRTIDPYKILERAFEVLEFEDILDRLIVELDRVPTKNATHRILEFIHSTTHANTALSTFDSEDFDDIIATTTERDKRPQHQKEIDFLIEQLNELIFVSKARLIMNDYPESISVSVQMSPSIEEHEAEMAMQAFEDLLTDYKPRGLGELEVSITNKVVY